MNLHFLRQLCAGKGQTLLWAVLSHSVLSDPLQLHGLQSTRLFCPCRFSRQEFEVGCHGLLQGIFPTQGSNSALPHHRQILYWLSHQGSPRILEWVASHSLLPSPRINPGSPALQADSLPAELPEKPKCCSRGIQFITDQLFTPLLWILEFTKKYVSIHFRTPDIENVNIPKSQMLLKKKGVSASTTHPKGWSIQDLDLQMSFRLTVARFTIIA